MITFFFCSALPSSVSAISASGESDRLSRSAALPASTTASVSARALSLSRLARPKTWVSTRMMAMKTAIINSVST